MKKNRYLLCLVACGAMVYFAIPKIAYPSDRPEGLFTIAWLFFAALVAAGNLSALLTSQKIQRSGRMGGIKKKTRRKSRSYIG
ncbi:MAG: hypothetical protein Q8898_05760 [Bacillota bacterium]|nr:hypothetical protein [Bacillota bacterium]